MNRGGVALIIVLAILAVLVASITVWISASSRAANAQRTWQVDAALWAQEQAAETLALSWLADQGGRLVAPPAGGSWTILGDRWAANNSAGWAVVTVYDGWSGIPPHLAGPRGPLRRLLPLACVSLELPIRAASDPFAPTDMLARWALSAGARRFPAPPVAPPSDASSWSVSGREAPPRLPPHPPAISSATILATVLSTHSGGQININTAPLALVERVLHQNGGLMPADLRHNREHGLRTEPPPDAGGDPGRAVLVGGTGVWNLHITVSFQSRVRSWWAVAVGNRPQPRIVQRYAVDP